MAKFVDKLTKFYSISGSCPTSGGDASSFGICEYKCRQDGQCDGDLKCCRNGCGYICNEPGMQYVHNNLFETPCVTIKILQPWTSVICSQVQEIANM